MQPMVELLAEEADAKLGGHVRIDMGRPLLAVEWAGGDRLTRCPHVTERPCYRVRGQTPGQTDPFAWARGLRIRSGHTRTA